MYLTAENKFQHPSIKPMNKLTLNISLLFISPLSYSQNSKMKFGIQTGLNYSNLRGYEVTPTPYYTESPAFAYLGGINLEYQIKEKLYLKFNLNYERKVQKTDNIVELFSDFEYNVYEFTTKKKFDYLVLPMMLKYNLTDVNSFYLKGGVFVGYLIKATLTNDLNSSEFEKVELDYKKLDLGFSFGLGKNFELNQNNSIYFEIRENLGLLNINKSEVWNNRNAKTNSINLIAGYYFN